MSDRSPEAGKSSGARTRREWPVRKWQLGDEPGEDLSTTTTAQERLAMMWPLAVEAWSLAGRPLPEYDRRDIPVRWLPPPVSK